MPRAAGRYHLYISLACPWANRCLAVRNLKVRPKRASHTSVQMRSSCQLDSSVDTVDCVLSSSLTALVTSGSAGLARRDWAIGHAPHLAAHAPGRPQGRAHRLGVCQAGRPAIHVDHRWGPAPERVWRGRHPGRTLSLPAQAGFGSFPPQNCIPDTVNGFRSVRDLYDKASDTFGARPGRSAPTSAPARLALAFVQVAGVLCAAANRASREACM